MPVPSIPTPLDQLGSSAFSFYPPILDVEHNEWMFRCATWDDIEVVNIKTGEALWVPRRFVGEISLVTAPVIMVGLLKELECREGIVYPHVRRVIEMPRAVNDSPRPRAHAPERRTPAPVVGIRVETGSISRTGRLIRGAVGVVACVAVAMIFHDATWGAHMIRSARSAEFLPFTAVDDYQSIVSRLGRPRHDEWLTGADGSGYRRLWYSQRSMAIVLVGPDRDRARYAGAIARDGRVIHSIGSAEELLSHLR
ncbi:MAG: hypothetical protein ACRD30_06680 [Bryobacteraceae bacterium]